MWFKEIRLYNIIKYAVTRNREIFLAVDDFPNYEISNFGRVRNVVTGRILKLSNNNTNGYKQVSLCRDKKVYNWIVHRLVGLSFIENPQDLPEIDHIDKCKHNNHYLNLRWADQKMQQRNKGISKNNTSHYKGVSFNGKSWRGKITDNDGNKISKSFSIKKYPIAKQLAINWRREKEIQFGYS